MLISFTVSCINPPENFAVAGIKVEKLGFCKLCVRNIKKSFLVFCDHESTAEALSCCLVNIGRNPTISRLIRKVDMARS